MDNVERMASEFTLRRRVEFADTDAAGIMHFARFFVYMEAAEHAFHRSLGGSVHVVKDGAFAGWPRVRAECEYLAPLRFEEEVDIRLVVREKKTRSMVYAFTFQRVSGDNPGELVARGSMTVVYVRRETDSEKMSAAPIPEPFASHVHVTPPKTGSP